MRQLSVRLHFTLSVLFLAATLCFTLAFLTGGKFQFHIGYLILAIIICTYTAWGLWKYKSNHS